jgi:hypothetical protein
VRIFPPHLKITDFQDTLAKVFSFQHANKTCRCILDTIRDANLGLERSILDPLRQLLLMIFCVQWPHIWVVDNKSSNSKTLADNLTAVLQAIDFVRW